MCGRGQEVMAAESGTPMHAIIKLKPWMRAKLLKMNQGYLN